MDEFSQVGFGLCCGAPPMISKLKDMLGMEAVCATCGHRQGYIGSWNVATMRAYWNVSLQRGNGAASLRGDHKPIVTPVLYKREGWRECMVDVSYARFGHTSSTREYNCLFKCDASDVDMLYAHDDPGYSCAVDDGRHVHDIMLENGQGEQIRLEWKDGKRYPYSYVYVTTGWCTDDMFSWYVAVHMTRARDYARLLPWCGELTDRH